MRYHLAILRNPWYQYLIAGLKPIESRWYKRKLVPYERIDISDIIFPKCAGRSMVNYCVTLKGIANLEDHTADELRRLKEAICIDEDYIKKGEKEEKTYLTLLYVDKIYKLTKPFEYKQSGQQAWIVDFKPPYEINLSEATLVKEFL